MDVPWIESFFTPTRGNRSLSKTGKGLVKEKPYDSSKKSGARNVTGGIRKPTDDFGKLLQQINRPMPRRATKRGRMAPSRRKAPRVKKTYKRKAPKRKSTKRKKRKVSKGVTLTVGTSRMRKIDHTEYKVHASATAGAALYVPFNSIGKKDEMLKSVAQSMLLHYMHRVGDYRANVQMEPVGGAIAESGSAQLVTWSKMHFYYLTVGATSEIGSSAIESTDSSTGAAYALDNLTDQLALVLRDFARFGRRLSQVQVFRADHTGVSTTTHSCILQDISAGRNVIEFSCKAQLKIQNTTPADATHTGAETCGHDNAMNIHRNPLSGLVYNFRNAVPKFKMQYLVTKTDAQRNHLDGLSNCYSTAAGGVDVPEFALNGSEWLVPPPAPSTIFSNVGSKSTVSIAPGGHKSFSLGESYKGAINSFMDRYLPRTSDGSSSYLGSFEVPPGGSCMMIGLKPTYRNAAQVQSEVQGEVSHIWHSRISRARLSPMPMANVLA